MKLSRSLFVGAAACTLAALGGCAMPGGGAAVEARLAPTRGSMTDGSVRFVQEGAKVRVSGSIRGLKPNADHGFHIHEKGDCSSGDGMSAGGHFNPASAPHGQAGQGAHHAGDLPSLKADGNGTARVDALIDGVTVAAGPTSVVSRGLIVHRDPDDYRTQPTGNAGPRLACAVIGA